MSSITSEQRLQRSNITTWRGDTPRFDVVVLRHLSDEIALPVDCTGGTAVMTARLRLNDPTPVFQRPGVHKGSGSFEFNLLKTDTSGLPSEDTTLVYDVQVTTAAGEVWTVTQGELLVKCDVTHD